jgi:hypothetical protein
MDEHRAEPDAGAVRKLEDFVERVGIPLVRADDPVALDAAAVHVIEAFAAVGIDALLLKGPALAQLLYLPGERRAYVDVDLLVAPGDLELARQTLARLGYRDASEALGIDDVGGVVHEESWVGVGPGAQNEVLIELHRWLAGARASPLTAWEALLARRTFIELQGRQMPVLNRDGLAMHLALHAAQHGPAYAKGCRELSLGLERWPQEIWKGAAVLAAEIEATEVFAAGLRLVPAGPELVQLLGLPADSRLDWEIRNADARPRGSFHLSEFLEARSLADRARVMRRALFPSPAWIAWQYPWAGRRGWRLVAAYVFHLLNALPTAARALRFRWDARRVGR